MSEKQIEIIYLTEEFDIFLRCVFQPKSVFYKYRFQCPDSSDYDPAFYELQLESLESFSWNLVDNVVGNHGTGEHKLSDVRSSRIENKRKPY